MGTGCREDSRDVEKVKGQRVDPTGQEGAGIRGSISGTVKCRLWSQTERKRKMTQGQMCEKEDNYLTLESSGDINDRICPGKFPQYYACLP